jgi:chromosome segregation ATPase
MGADIMQSREVIQNQLDGIIEEIGKARANGNDLVSLRMKRNELEQELSELDAESSFLKKRDAEAKREAHREAIEKTLSAYGESEKRYTDAVKRLHTTIERLNGFEEILKTQVDNITSLPNPLLILQGIWDELASDTQREYQARFSEAYSRDVLPKSRIQEILDRLSFHQNLLSSAANRLTVTKPQGPRKVGGGMTIQKTPDDQVPSELKRTPQQLEVPKINRNKRLIPGAGRPQRVAQRHFKEG